MLEYYAALAFSRYVGNSIYASMLACMDGHSPPKMLLV